MMKLSELERDLFFVRIDNVIEQSKFVGLTASDDDDIKFVEDFKRELVTGNVDARRAIQAKKSLDRLHDRYLRREQEYRAAEDALRKWLHS